MGKRGYEAYKKRRRGHWAGWYAALPEEEKQIWRNKMKERTKAKRAAWTEKDWAEHRRRENERRRKRRMKAGKHCVFCGILFGSKFTDTAKSRSYCTDCRADPDIKRYLDAWYARRLRQRRKGLPLEPLLSTTARKVYKRVKEMVLADDIK